MEKTNTFLLSLAGGGGLIAALLRLWMRSMADEKGLLPRNTLPSILLVLVSLGVMGVWVYFCLRKRGKKGYRANFPASPSGALGCLCAAVGIALILTPGHGALGILALISGILSILALLLLAYHRYQGTQPTVLLHSALCIYFVFRLLNLYRVWCASPQVDNYAFPLLASVCVLLACFGDAAFTINSGRIRSHTFLHLAAVFFCLAALPGSDAAWTYLALGAYMATDLCTPQQRRAA